MKYIYTFGYQNGSQISSNDQFGGDDENSASIVIDAESERDAITWGRVISEEFFKWVLNDMNVSWREMGYASFVKIANEEVVNIPMVYVGEMPDLELLLP